MASEHAITHFPPLPQHSYNSPNLPVLPKSSQGSLGPTVLLSLLFPVRYGLTEVSHLHIWRVCKQSGQSQVTARKRGRGGRMQEIKETSSDQTSAVQEMTCRHQRKQHTRCIAFEEILYGLLPRTTVALADGTLADVKKIKASECHSVPVL